MYSRLHHNIRPAFMSRIRTITKTARVIVKPSLSASAYKPDFVERHIYEDWEKKGLFVAENFSDKPSFSMVLPPPNVTGKLHLGHALASTVQDVIVRTKRARGHNVLWLPGTDHAGIATQGVVEKHIRSTLGLSRQEIGREKFNTAVWEWTAKHGNAITKQLRTLGCSLDWTREMFTMDHRHIQAVNIAFTRLFNKGLIYRKKALVNWCNTLNSTVSDIEIDNVDIKGPIAIVLPGYAEPIKFGLMYDIAFKVFGSNEEVIVSTTMPETLMGDVAVAVNPNDPRYAHLATKMLIHPLTDNTLPIIFDEFVNMQVGSGAVKITPAHSKTDYDVAQAHNLPMLQVIDENGKMINSQAFDNLRRYDCRKKILVRLDEMGILKKITPHNMTLPLCSRSNDIVDYLPKEQWFLKCKELNAKAMTVVDNGILKIMPEKFVKHWTTWCEDNRDWCISRQLWWGQRVPAYKCMSPEGAEMWVAAPNLMHAKKQAAAYWRVAPLMVTTIRDTDVLDTWFSSAIYPFSALGWPGNYTDDYKMFYPLDLMATGHDILGLWVHRMVILGLELTGSLPFENILLHGIVCDNRGAKMSKSKGNVIDPLDVIYGISLDELKLKTRRMHEDGILSKAEMLKTLDYHKSNFSNTKGIPECGVDALRFTLLSQDIKSNFINFDVNMCHSNKLFCNKIWQSVNFVQLMFDKLESCRYEKCFEDVQPVTENDLTLFDKWILSKLACMVAVVNKGVDSYDFHLATKAIRTFLYNEFCDVYIESTKHVCEAPNPSTAYAHAHTLSAALNAGLRCLNPFMVYLTQELIPKIPQFEHNIIFNYEDAENKFYDFPNYGDFLKWQNPKVEEQVEKLLSAVYLVRQLKGFYGMSNKLRPTVHIQTSNKDLRSDIELYKTLVCSLAKCKELEFSNVTGKNFVSGVLDKDTQVYVEIVGKDIDVVISEAREQLLKKVMKLEEHLNKMEQKLSGPSYSTSMPEWTQMIDRETLLMKREELKNLQRLVIDPASDQALIQAAVVGANPPSDELTSVPTVSLEQQHADTTLAKLENQQLHEDKTLQNPEIQLHEDKTLQNPDNQLHEDKTLQNPENQLHEDKTLQNPENQQLNEDKSLPNPENQQRIEDKTLQNPEKPL